MEQKQEKQEKKVSVRANVIDRHVGYKLKECRNILGMTQEQIGVALGITFQQVQKYEQGTNRISAGKLYELSKILGVDISFFYNNAPDTKASAKEGGFAEENMPYHADVFDKKETHDLIKAYYNVTDEKLRRKLLELIKTASLT